MIQTLLGLAYPIRNTDKYSRRVELLPFLISPNYHKTSLLSLHSAQLYHIAQYTCNIHACHLTSVVNQ